MTTLKTNVKDKDGNFIEIKVHCSFDKLVPIADIRPHPKNRNEHPPEQIERLAKLFLYQGIRKPITVSNLSEMISAGHGRRLVAIYLGLTHYPVDFQDYESEEQELSDRTADNAAAFWAEVNKQLIAEDILEFGPEFDVDMLGFEEFEIVAADLYEDKDADSVPDIKDNELGVKLGDIYQLGEHRLMCGDATKDLSILMNGEIADITFTSPPYNVANTPKEDGKYKNYSDDKSEIEFCKLLKDFTLLSLSYSDFVFCNIQSLAGNKTALIDFLYDLKNKYADTIVWNKLNAQPAMARKVLNSQFEYVHIFSNKANRSIGVKDFRGTISNVLDMNSKQDKELASEHKATFPVDFAKFFIENFSLKSCIDPFGGTGSTLIACEKTGRKCFMMELDPHYCSLIIRRWEEFTGNQALLL